MNIGRWLALLIPHLIVTLPVAVLMAPIVALFSTAKAREYFPWFVTWDNPITGDVGHELRWLRKPKYVKKLTWLLRNRAYGFSSMVTGVKPWLNVKVNGDPLVGNRPLREGIVTRTTPDGTWQIYLVYKSFAGRCLRVNIGWKLWGDPSHPNFGQYTFAINPFMGYSDA